VNMDMQEIFWQEKSKVKWHLDGHRNTVFFHIIAKIKKIKYKADFTHPSWRRHYFRS